MAIFKLDTHEKVKELECDESLLITHAIQGEFLSIGCDDQNIYFFSSKTYVRQYKVAVYDDLLCLHFVSDSILVCG